MTENDKRTRADIEWENRILCSDEACIGVIGPDGRCKECGRPYEGEFTPVAGDADFIAIDDEATDVDEDYPETETEDGGDIDWENRILCSDEACIGVIGPDGRCKECGKPYVKEGSNP